MCSHTCSEKTLCGREPYFCLHHKIQRQKNALEYLQKPDMFLKQVLWVNKIKMEVCGNNQKTNKEFDLFGGKKEQHFMKKTPRQLSNMGGDLSRLKGCVASRDSGNIAPVEVGRDSTSYLHILEANICRKDEAYKGRIMQQCKDLKHT